MVLEVAQAAATLLKDHFVENSNCTVCKRSDLAQITLVVDLELKSQGLNGGSTVACVLFRHQTSSLLFANAGASRIILSKSGKVYRLSETHSITNDKEIDRVKSTPGEFIRNNRVYGTHQVARGLGGVKYHLKGYIIAEPYKNESSIEELDEFLIIGSDRVSNISDTIL